MKKWDKRRSENVDGGECRSATLICHRSRPVPSAFEADVKHSLQTQVATETRKQNGSRPPRTASDWAGAIVRWLAGGLRPERAATAVPGRISAPPENDIVAAPPAPLGLQHSLSAMHSPSETHEAMERVQRALDTLDLSDRTVFMLYELEGEDCDHIAAALDVAVTTVCSRLHSARRRFVHAHAELLRQQRQASPSSRQGWRDALQ